ncbi:MAG: haloacid dehalogenase type II [Candidatus Pelagadaptatus aseana]|uniref:haloacid dehalogenase type II n=1 Tax=Candidatus Pelagadaptatus aseana TaxID=3120508 RepID=UPI0039B347C5
MNGKTLLFDINETVLDLSVLKPKFRDAFGSEQVTGQWFAMLLHSSTVCAITGVQTNFRELSRVALQSLAARLGINLAAAHLEDILGGFASLPAHPDIKPALARLRDAGFRTVAFSNSSEALIAAQIGNAGLADYFDRVISVEGAATFKPDPRAYQFAARELQEPEAQLRLVACHDWDTHGAINAGMQAAYLDRSGAPYNPLFKRPDIAAASMGAIVDQVIAVTE